MSIRKLVAALWITLVLVGGGLSLSACRQQEQKVITRLDDAAEGRIGVMTGSTSEPLAVKRFPKASVQSFDNIADAFAALKSGQLDAVITAYSTAFIVAKKNPDLKILEERLSHEDTAIAVRKGNEGMLKQVDGIIGVLKADGTIKDIDRRWLKTEPGPYEEPNIAVPPTGTPLKVGVSATREPFSFVDEKGRVTGHDGELAKRIAAKMGRPLEFLDMRFMALIPALESGKIDLIVTGMSATDERRKHVDFTQPYYANSQILLVRNAPSQPAGQTLNSADDIADKRIAVLAGSAHEAYATAHYPKAQLLRMSTFADVALAVSTNKADAGLADVEGFKVIADANPDLGTLGKPLFSSPVGIGFRKDNTELRDSFNRFLAGIKKDGTFDAMWQRWVVERDATMPDIPLDGRNGTLVVGTSGGGLPFSAVKDNQMVGLDMELVRRFAAANGKEVQIANMEFGSLVAAVAAGKADLIADSIYITDERLKRISFSDPYFSEDTVAIAQKARIAGQARSVAGATGRQSFWQSLKESFEGNILAEKRYLLVWDGFKTTIVISLFSAILGTLLGGMVCLMRMARSPLLTVPARTYISLLRGMPVVVLLMLIFYVVFASVNIDPMLVAVIAFGLNFAAYVAEIFRAGVESIDRGQTEGALAMGFTKPQTFRLVILPQAIRRVLPVYKGEFISLVKMTSIVGYIAVQDLTKAGDIIRSRTFDAFFPLVMVAILYFIISYFFIELLDGAERLSDPRRRTRKAS